MRKTVFLCLVFICGSMHLRSQDYTRYHRTFNRIDQEILAGDYVSAISRLDSIDAAYRFIYARHCIKALQVCCQANDSLRAAKWMNRAFRQGVPLWLLRNNPLCRVSLSYHVGREVAGAYDSLHRLYLASVNHVLAQRINALMIRDQAYTHRVNDGFILFRHTVCGLQWKNNNQRQFEVIHNIIDSFGFPGERLIGLPPDLLDSATSAKSLGFYGPEVNDSRAYIMLIHCYSYPRKDINEKLLKNLHEGYLPAYQYAALNDFLARWGRGRYGDYSFYNTWHTDPVDAHIGAINARRLSIGLNTYDEQQRNVLLMRERRKTRSAGQYVILE